MKKLYAGLKLIGMISLGACLVSFIYFSISVRFPVLSIDQSPAVKVSFLKGNQEELRFNMRVSRVSSRFRFGSHMGLNPIFILARKAFDRPKSYSICFDAGEMSSGFPLLRRRSNDWFNAGGWEYYATEEYLASYLESFSKTAIVSRAVLVEDNCASLFTKNTVIADYAFFYDMPKLDAYRLGTKIYGISFNNALEQAESRLEFDAGFTELNTAIQRDCLSCVKELILSGVNPNGPIGEAAAGFNPDPQRRTSMFSPLKRARDKGNDEIVQYLISQGAKM